ncbi:MAG TPA: exodeoxyribonuclease VII large subunit [Planctomycetota bacterium]
MAFPAERAERKVLSIGDLTKRIKSTLETGIPYVWVAGEMSNYKGPGPSGHLYFTLKDAESAVPCAMWRGFAAKLKFEPENGMQVVAGGRVEVYVPHGKYQLIVETLEPRGVGALQLKFEQLKEKLQKEGLFEAARKRPLPFLPRKIALVTSPTGAAVQDILRTLRGRCPAVHVLLYPVRVQGEGSAQEVAAAIGHINLAMPDVDVLIVGRGGGSIEDLWAFNEEVVARAIHASRIPVISAVGHETDTTIADFVADVRALTPTDGAVRAVPVLEDLILSLADLETQLKRALRTRAQLARSVVDGLAEGRDLGRVEELPAQLGQRLDDLQERLASAARQAPALVRQRLDRLDAALYADLPRAAAAARERANHLNDFLRSHAVRAVDAARARVREAAASLEALSPVSILARGYSITYRDGKIVKDAREVKPGDRLRTRLGSGEIDSRVES